MWTKGNTTLLLMGEQTCTANMDISVAHIQEDSNQFISLWGIYSKDASFYPRDTCSIMFIAALFIIVRHSKQPFCPQTMSGKRKCGTCI